MSIWKTSAALLVGLLLVGASALLATTPARAGNAGNALNPTPTLIVSDWSYLPYVRGIVLGPTVTPTNPPPTRTPYFTLTPSATPTATSSQTPTSTATTTPTPSPSSTPTATNTVAPSSTPTPSKTSTPPPSSNTGELEITEIFYDGDVHLVESDEYVEIRNADERVVRLEGWKLHDSGQNNTFVFPTYNMEPGEVCRVYTNEDHSQWCGFNWGSDKAIWGNSGDEATLQDGSDQVIDTCGYSGGGKREYC